MTIAAYLEAIKERLVTDPMVTRFHREATKMRPSVTVISVYLHY